MAAHLEGLGATVLDFTGFAQKFGSVISYIRLANEPSDLNQVRIDERSADSVIACDIVVSTSPKASSTYRSGTQVALNTAVMPTGDMILHRDANLQIDRRQQVIEDTVGSDNVNAFDANQAAESLLGDAVFANVMMMGYAWQLGMIPVSLASLDRAIELNAVQIDKNRLAFKIGRVLSSGKESISQLLPKTPDLVDSLDELIEHRAQYLIEYQNDNWASRFRATMEQIKAVESEFGSEEISKATARSLFKLMSYKDEYEVARLHSQTGFREKLERLFEGDFTVHYHLAPPLLGRDKDHRGRPKKREFSRGIYPAFSVLSKLKWLRGSFADPFGWTAERRMERELIAWFERLITTCCEELNANNHDLWLEIMQSPMNIRGYGPVKEESVVSVKRHVNDKLGRVG
jgi:indolepyruvate ferredoxin oxidoreductase